MKNRIFTYTLSAIVSVILLLFCTAGFAENIDPGTSNSQYDWGENVGWVHFSSAGPIAYRVRLLIYHAFLPLVMREYP